MIPILLLNQSKNAPKLVLFFTYLWKSIALGEFYIVPEYANTLRPIETKANEGTKIRIPALLNYYSYISSSVTTFINRINPLKKDGLYELHVELQEDLIVDSVSEQYIQSKLLKPLIKLTQLLLDITVIDIRYVASENNLSKLVNFIYAINKFKNDLSSCAPAKEIHRAVFIEKAFESSGLNALKLFQDTAELLIYKACVLSNQIIMQTAPNERICFDYDKLANAEINSIIEQYTKYTIDYSNDLFHRIYDCKYHASSAEYKNSVNELEKIYKNNIQYSEQNFIRNYNERIHKGINKYIEDYKLFALIKENNHDAEIIKAIDAFVKEYGHRDISINKCISPSTLVLIIQWLYNYLDENKERKHKEITLFGKSLNCLRRVIVVYKNEKDSPYRFRSYFEYSFYKIESSKTIRQDKSYIDFIQYDSSEFEESLFFASLGYSPINILFLENFFLYYNRKFRIFESEAIEDSVKTSNDLSAQSKTTIETIRDERDRTLQLVGLLGTFIAFVASIVGTQHVAKDIYDYMLFALTFTTGVLVFVLCIYSITNYRNKYSIESTKEKPTSKDESKDDKNKKTDWLEDLKDIKWIILGLLIIAIVTLTIIRPERPDKTDKDNTTELVNSVSNTLLIKTETKRDSLPK